MPLFLPPLGPSLAPFSTQNFFGVQWYQYNSIQIPPPSENFGYFQGGGSVQNPDSNGACGGLLKKVDFTFHNTLKCIHILFKLTVYNQQIVLVTVSSQCNIQVLGEFRMENMKKKLFLGYHIKISFSVHIQPTFLCHFKTMKFKGGV